MRNFLPRTLDLCNPEKGDSFYCVTLKPVKCNHSISVFTFANDRYQAMENAWETFRFCDIDPQYWVCKLS